MSQYAFHLALLGSILLTPPLAQGASPAQRYIENHPEKISTSHRLNREKPVAYRGLKVGPYAGSPADAAQAFLDAHGDLLAGPASTLQLRQVFKLGPDRGDGYGPAGAVIRFRQGRGDIRTAHDVVAVEIDGQGFIRSLHQEMVHIPKITTPTLSFEEAGAKLAGLGYDPSLGFDGQLTFHAPGKRARLAYYLYPRVPGDALQERIVVDAHDGGILSHEVITHSHEYAPREDPFTTSAYAYLENPFKEDAPTLVELGDEVNEFLSGPRMAIKEGIDLGEMKSYSTADGGKVDGHVVTYVSPGAPVDGLYDYEPIPFPSDPALDEDEFAAPHLYYTVTRGLDYFWGLGLDAIRGEPLAVYANCKWPNAIDEALLTDPEAPLAPVNNAYFTDSYESNGQTINAKLTFCQGELTDFGYDADVVLHELGHGVVNTLGGPTGLSYDAYGMTLEPYALNEGLSDYFSAAFQGDGQTGEYAGLQWEPDGAGIRDLDAYAACPDTMIGQQHNDSTIFTSALWETRKALGPVEQANFDQAVYSALAAMSVRAAFEEAAEDVLASVERLVNNDVKTQLAAAFDARQVRNCGRFIGVEAKGLEESVFRYTPITGPSSLGTSEPVPANIQLKLDLPAGKQKVTMQFLQTEYRGVRIKDYGYDRAPQPMVVYGNAGSPVEFGISEYGARIDPVLSVGTRVADAKEVVDAELLSTTSYYFYTYQAEWYVDNQPGDYYISLANDGYASSNAYYIAFATEEVEVIPGEEEEEGCGGCDRGGEETTASALILAAMGLFLRRRRR